MKIGVTQECKGRVETKEKELSMNSLISRDTADSNQIKISISYALNCEGEKNVGFQPRVKDEFSSFSK